MQIPPNSPRPPAFNFASFIKFSLTFVLLAGNIFTANRLQVQWSSGDVVLKDLSGEELDPGQVDINQDGDLVQLGYFTDSSPENLFNGEWNVLTSNTRIGDSSTLSNQSAGLFQFSTLFEVGTNTVEVFPDWPGGYVTSSEIVIEQGNPLFGKLIAVRFLMGQQLKMASVIILWLIQSGNGVRQVIQFLFLLFSSLLLLIRTCSIRISTNLLQPLF